MHSSYQRIVTDAETALLCIHGIVGTPRHFDKMLQYVPENISIYNILLHGHGKDVKDFSNASMNIWEFQISQAVDLLSKNHKNIYILAHSMGTLLAIGEAVRNKHITKLFLLAVPLRLHVTPLLFHNLWHVFWDRIDSNDPIAVAAKACYGIKQNRNLFLYLGWVPRYIELFKKIAQIRRLLPSLTTPATVCQSHKDELVSLRSLSPLNLSPAISVRVLECSSHFYYHPADFETLVQEFTIFIQEGAP